MAVGPNLKAVEGEGGPSRNGGDPPATNRAARQFQAATRSFYLSNNTRSQLPGETTRKLDDIRKLGNDLLNALQPYSEATVFTFRFAEQMHRDSVRTGRYPNAIQVAEGATNGFRANLDLAAKEFMGERFAVFPESDRDLETTSAISAFLFLGAAARYCPEIVFQSAEGAETKQAIAERFIRFFDANLASRMELTKRWNSAREFHADCYAAYLEFKTQLPELFDDLRAMLRLTERAELLAPYGNDAFTMNWAPYHYMGRYLYRD